MKKAECRSKSGDTCHVSHVAFLRSALIYFIICYSYFFLPPLSAQERPTDYQVKAVFLKNFGKFVEWPETAFADARAPLVIGVFGGADNDPFHGALDILAANDTINGRAIEVHSIKSLSDLRSCHILFVAAAAKSQERELLDAVNGMSILTVGDSDDFCNEGGMIQFIIKNDQVHFAINNAAARVAGLKVSSKLLILSQPLKN
jgi:hypothetical protein